ncbi:MAG: hypothetical protein ABJC05_02775 [Pyrinomonadaceae bacterium]
MKKQLYTMTCMMILAGFMAMSSAKAQTSASRQLIANIPFEFSVGNKSMPAGDYTVRQINPASDRAVLQLRSKDGSTSAMVQMRSVSGKTQESAKLVFHRYGNQYFFAQVWTTGDSEGLEAPKSHAERGMVERLAGIAPRNESIALTSRK